MSRARSTRSRVVGLGLVILSVACSSIAIQRDLSKVPPGQVGFDDMCGLQEYFDALAIKTVPPPRVVSALDLEGLDHGKRVRGGRERYAFENDFELQHLRRVLNENWRGLPEQIATSKKIEIEVQWSEKAGTKRVLTGEDAKLGVGGQDYALPYHPCLSELLYGEPLYRQRRTMWNLPLPAMKTTVDGGVTTTDGGAAATGARSDAGASER
jgi:hypothetical protein